MSANLRIHLAAGASLLVLVGIVALFWAYPKLLVYILLAIVAALAYGALYLVFAAWMDPEKRQPAGAGQTAVPEETDTEANAGNPAADAHGTTPDVEPPAGRRKRTTRKQSTRKKTTRKKSSP